MAQCHGQSRAPNPSNPRPGRGQGLRRDHDKLLPIGTSLTADQAGVLQRLAWDVVSNYSDCGLYEDGTQACATPTIENDGKTIKLGCATPGAWLDRKSVV